MQIEDFNILDLIPQRAPLLMVDSLIGHDEKCSTTLFTIPADNILVRDGELTAEGMLENIAQTAAARAGYGYLSIGLIPPIGYIGSITKIKIHKCPKVGAQIKTSTCVKGELFNITLLKGEVRVDGELYAECEMKTVRDDKEE